MKILYCTDFSDAARYSFERALPFLKPECEADIISVLETGYEHIKVYTQNKIENLEKTKHYLQSRGLNTVEILHPIGDPAEEILEQLQKEKYDLVIAGSRRSLLSKWLGSTSRKIVSKSAAAVFIARRTGPAQSLQCKKNILLTVDGSENSYNSISRASEILDFTGSTLEILTVKQGKEGLPVEILSDREWLEKILALQEENAQEIIKQSSRILEENGIKIDAKQVIEGDPAEEIMKYAENQGKDLIIMGTHGRTGVSSLLLGSVSKRVLDYTSCPVVIVPAKRI